MNNNKNFKMNQNHHISGGKFGERRVPGKREIHDYAMSETFGKLSKVALGCSIVFAVFQIGYAKSAQYSKEHNK